jgi:uncharacterized protein (DUF58 family)
LLDALQRVGGRLAALRLTPLLSRGLPPHTTIALRVRWPLLLLGVALIAQLLMPDPVWSTVAICLALLHLGCWLWVRLAATGITLERSRAGSLLVVGDTLEEEFRLQNSSTVPLAWAEVMDESTLPGYTPGRVVGVGATSSQRWRTTALCTRRGLFRLGPHRIVSGDPLALFTLTLEMGGDEELLIHPRVVRLPALPLPRGDLGGETRSRRPLFGVQPAPTVRTYHPQDDLRFVHWPATARQGALMVRELDLEPAGDLWVLLDTHAPPFTAPEREGAPETADPLEAAVVAAASIASAVLESKSGRGVGLLAADGQPPALRTLPPQRRRDHLWSLLAALAPISASALPLADLLAQSRSLLPARSSLLVVTADLAEPDAVDAWTARLVGLRERGFHASALLITTPATEGAAAAVQGLLARHRIESALLPAGARLPAAHTHRRRRTVIRSSPLGRAFTVEVEEEVG